MTQAKVDDGSPTGVQGSPPFSPFVDDEVDKLGKCCVVAILQRKRTGMFAKFADDFYSGVPVIFRIFAGESVPVGRRAFRTGGARK